MLYDHFRSENRSLDPVAVLLEAIEQRQIFYFSRLFHTISLQFSERFSVYKNEKQLRGAGILSRKVIVENEIIFDSPPKALNKYIIQGPSVTIHTYPNIIVQQYTCKFCTG